MSAQHTKRLEYLRGEIEAERISYGEIAELCSLAKYIDPSDTLLLQWAGVPEKDPAAVSLGRRGGKVNSQAQQAARARNAKLGGWPKGRKRGPRRSAAPPAV
jgi:hypothetical protein